MGKKITNWDQIIEQHRRSRKSIPDFCSEIGIHPNTFYKHRKRMGRQDISGDTAVVEVKPFSSSPAEPIVLKTKRFMISISAGFDEAGLKSVLKVIGELE